MDVRQRIAQSGRNAGLGVFLPAPRPALPAVIGSSARAGGVSPPGCARRALRIGLRTADACSTKLRAAKTMMRRRDACSRRPADTGRSPERPVSALHERRGLAPLASEDELLERLTLTSGQVALAERGGERGGVAHVADCQGRPGLV